MTGMMYGADAEELEQIAKELDGYESELGQLLLQGVGAVSLVGLSATLGSIWRGPRAGEFAGIWQSRHLLRLRDAQQILSAAANDLRGNATEQRTTSAVGGGSFFDGWPINPVFPGQPWLNNPWSDFRMPNIDWGTFRDELLDRSSIAIDMFDWGYALVEGAPYFHMIRGLGGSVDDGLRAVIQVANNSPVGRALGAVGAGLSVIQTGISAHEYGFFDGRTYIEAVKGIGGVVAGSVAGPPGAAAWWASTEATDWVMNKVDDRFDHSGAFINSVIAREGKVPNYDGPGGIFRWGWDGVENAFGSW